MAVINKHLEANHKFVNTQKQNALDLKLQEHLFIAWLSFSTKCLPRRRFRNLTYSGLTTLFLLENGHGTDGNKSRDSYDFICLSKIKKRIIIYTIILTWDLTKYYSGRKVRNISRLLNTIELLNNTPLFITFIIIYCDKAEQVCESFISFNINGYKINAALISSCFKYFIGNSFRQCDIRFKLYNKRELMGAGCRRG